MGQNSLHDYKIHNKVHLFYHQNHMMLYSIQGTLNLGKLLSPPAEVELHPNILCQPVLIL